MKARSRIASSTGSRVQTPAQGDREKSLECENERLNAVVKDLQQKLDVCMLRINDLERHTAMNSKRFPVSDCDIGVLRYLQLCQRKPHERKFYCSQSSAELYGIINPNTDSYYGSPDKGDAWIQFEFVKPITVFGFLIQSYLSCFIKSYRIVAVGDDYSESVVFSTACEIGLKGEKKQVTHRFDKPVKTRRLRFEQTGPSWAEKNFIGIKRMDFQTDQCEGFYFENVMKTVQDPHKVPVNITAKYFDVYSFTVMNPVSYVCTFDTPSPSWFQIEFAEGQICITGYRIKKHESLRMKAWSVKGSNDATLELDKWKEIHRVCEEKEGPLFRVFSCPKSDPYKYIRIIMEGHAWNDRDYLAFWHFEVFGDYVIM